MHRCNNNNNDNHNKKIHKIFIKISLIHKMMNVYYEINYNVTTTTIFVILVLLFL